MRTCFCSRETIVNDVDCSKKLRFSRRESNVIVPLRSCQQFSNIVIAQTGAKPERTRLGTIAFRRRRLQYLVQANAQRVVDDLLERFAQFGSTLLCFSRHIGVESQCRPHICIMMLTQGNSRCYGVAASAAATYTSDVLTFR